MQALLDFWSNAGKAALDLQQSAGSNFANMVGKMPGFPMSPPETDGVDLAQAARTLVDFWGTVVTMSGSLQSPLAPGGQASTDPAVEAMFRAVADPRVWFKQAGGLDVVISEMAEGAQFTDIASAGARQHHDAHHHAHRLQRRRRGAAARGPRLHPRLDGDFLALAPKQRELAT